MQTEDTTPEIQIDTKWFQDQLKDRDISQREFGRRTGMDPSTVSLLLQGKRRMRAEQAAVIARVLDLPIALIIQKAGVILNERAVTGRLIPLVATIDAESRATLDWENPKHALPLDQPVSHSASVIRWNTMHTPADICDGWVGVVGQRMDGATVSMVGRTGLIEVEGQGAYLGQVRRGYREGLYTILRAGQPPIQDVAIGKFAPLLLVIPN